MFKGMDQSLKYTFYGIFAIFLSLFAATYHTLKVAFTGNEGVMNKNYYEVGLNYEKFIEDQKVMIEEGYHFEGSLLSLNPSLKKGVNTIEIEFLKGNDKLNTAEVELKIEKRATDNFTKITKLTREDNGKYIGNIELQNEGKWFITITGIAEGRVLKKYFPVDVVN